MLEDKYIGLLLAVASSFAIGSSYVITKKGLQDARERHGFEGDGYQYFKNPIWWGGIITLVIGEAANFAAYAFAPAVLVTPLGALSVLSGAILGAYFLNEKLGKLGRLGCFICFAGSVIIASHAPPDEKLETVDQILHYAIQPGETGRRLDPWHFTNGPSRIFGLLHICRNLFLRDDIQGLPQVRQAEPVILPVNLCSHGIGLRHGRKGVRNCAQVDL
jgi:hypothetical protein